MYFRLALIVSLLMLAGCVQMSSRFVNGSEYDRAVVLYENGRIIEARERVKAIPKESPDYKAARKFLSEINAFTLQLSRRHMELAEDYEKAGIYGKAVVEYSEAIRFNPSNLLARNKVEVLSDAIRSGEKQSLVKKPLKKNGSSPSKEDPEDLANLHYLKGKIYLESKAYARAIEEFTTVLKFVPAYMNVKDLLALAKKERDKAVDTHLKRGIAHFQTEEMELAIKEWDTVLELDPSNRVAADYKYRAEVIMERLRNIREKQATPERPL